MKDFVKAVSEFFAVLKVLAVEAAFTVVFVVFLYVETSHIVKYLLQ